MRPVGRSPARSTGLCLWECSAWPPHCPEGRSGLSLALARSRVLGSLPHVASGSEKVVEPVHRTPTPHVTQHPVCVVL